MATPLRWVGIASAANSKIDYALSGGINSGEDIVKSILAGASAVEVCSIIYKEGNNWIAKAINTLFQWQEDNNFNSIEEYKGKMNAKNQDGSERLMRIQFLKYFENKK